MKDFTKEEAEYFAHVGTESDNSPLTQEQEDDLWEMRQLHQTYTIEQGFDVAAHARTKCAGSVGYTNTMASAREKAIKACPLMQEVKQNQIDAERRLRNSKGKAFPEENNPADQYKPLGLSDEVAREALQEFLEDVSEDMGSSERKFATVETLFKQGASSNLIGNVRRAVRACFYCYHSNSANRVDKLLGIKSKELYREDFLDWYYNYQHYRLGEVHMLFSEFYEKLLEKSLQN